MSLALLALLGCTGGTATGTSDSSSDTGTPPDSQDTRLGVTDPSALPQGDAPCREPVFGWAGHVYDGDTIYVTPEGSSVEETIRLIGIDTPELGWEDEPDDCYGPEATSEARRLVDDRWVWLTFDAECEDHYDRTLAYVHLGVGDDDFVNRSLVRGGFAWAYAVEPNVSFEVQLQQDEIAAIQQSAGLWSACAR